MEHQTEGILKLLYDWNQAKKQLAASFKDNTTNTWSTAYEDFKLREKKLEDGIDALIEDTKVFFEEYYGDTK